MCKHFTHTETEDPWQGHTIRMCIAATLSASFKVCSDSLALTLSLSRSLSLTSSLLFWTWQQAVNGKNNDESFFTSACYRSMNTRTLEYMWDSRTRNAERGKRGAVPSPEPRTSRFSSAYRKANAIESYKMCMYTPVSMGRWVCTHLFVCLTWRARHTQSKSIQLCATVYKHTYI